jgi:hypothetical protein
MYKVLKTLLPVLSRSGNHQRMINDRLRDIGTIVIGIVSVLAIISIFQYRLPKGKPVRIEAKVLAFDGRYSRTYLRNIVFVNVKLLDGPIIALWLPNEGLGCMRGDIIWLDKYDNRYEVADLPCRKP